MTILAIDPGSEKSGIVVIQSGIVRSGAEIENESLCQEVAHLKDSPNLTVAIEMVASYGMAVGKEVFDTCVWIGRFYAELSRIFGVKPVFVFRKDIKMNLCHTMKAKDSNIRQALIDKHGKVGTKKNPGPLFGVSGHLWSALAVADYVMDMKQQIFRGIGE